MDQFRIKKLQEQIEIQSRLKGNDSLEVAEHLDKTTDWNKNFNFEKITTEYLKNHNLLRSQVQKSCKIRDGLRIK